MAGKNRVVWSEGMFLRPQHFQQHDRFIENLVEGRSFCLQSFGWGFYSLKVDQEQLGLGKLALSECRGIMPDGTPFNLPEDDPLPIPLDLSDDVRNSLIYLALPVRRPSSTEFDGDDKFDPMARYRVGECEVKDSNIGADDRAALQIGNLQTSIMSEHQERSNHVCLGIVRVVEVRSDKTVLLDADYIPPTLNCANTANLLGFIKEVHGLLNTRSEALAGRVSEAGRGGVAEIADFLLLQVVNRFQPLFEHLSNLGGLHPESYYRIAIQLAGEFATFTRQDKRVPNFPIYRHDDLQATFAPVMTELRQSLSTVLEQNAIPIPLSKPKYGIYAGRLTDRNLLDSAIFILAAKADVSPDMLRSRFPTQVKVGPAEKIQQLVQSALPGIRIVPLSVAPRQIPYHAGFSYFELSKQGDSWTSMKTAGGFAIHVGGEFPALELEFWAIRSG